MDRRSLLKAALMASAGAGGLFLSRWLFDDDSPGPARNPDQWLENLSRTASLQVLADQYPGAFDVLKQGLLLGSLTVDSIQSQVKAAIVKDFADGNLVIFEDWRLSGTEALLIAAAIQTYGVSDVNQTEKTVDNAPFEDFLKVEHWGPQVTYQGVKFNEQPDGHCGLWFVTDSAPLPFKLFLGGEQTNVFPGDTGFTSGIYHNVEEFIGTVGKTEILAYDDINHRKQVIGYFEVLPAFDFYRYENGQLSRVFGELGRWGPKSSSVGEIFNEQPNGNAAFWVKINSMSNRVNLSFNGHEVRATVRKGIVTASFSPELLPEKPGNYPVQLKNEEHDEVLHVGDFQVR